MPSSCFRKNLALICLLSLAADQICFASESIRLNPESLAKIQSLSTQKYKVFTKDGLNFVLIANENPRVENNVVLAPSQRASAERVAFGMVVLGVIATSIALKNVWKGLLQRRDISRLESKLKSDERLFERLNSRKKDLNAEFNFWNSRNVVSQIQERFPNVQPSQDYINDKKSEIAKQDIETQKTIEDSKNSIAESNAGLAEIASRKVGIHSIKGKKLLWAFLPFSVERSS